MRVAIGDIHGCFKSFRHLVEEKIKPSKSDEIYLLGDYIDRGPASKQVIDYIFQLKNQGFQVTALRGNHEELLVDAYRNQTVNNFKLWMFNGAGSTLLSYGIESYEQAGRACLNELPENHLSFMREMPYYVLLEDFILVHAGINFESGEPFKDFESMVWCRECDNDLEQSGDRIIVHGHTPIPLSSIQESGVENPQKMINIDTGCVYKGSFGMGHLTALDLDSFELFWTENLDF